VSAVAWCIGYCLLESGGVGWRLVVYAIHLLSSANVGRCLLVSAGVSYVSAIACSCRLVLVVVGWCLLCNLVMAVV
jgi:hypothetical protein